MLHFEPHTTHGAGPGLSIMTWLLSSPEVWVLNMATEIVIGWDHLGTHGKWPAIHFCKYNCSICQLRLNGLAQALAHFRQETLKWPWPHLCGLSLGFLNKLRQREHKILLNLHAIRLSKNISKGYSVMHDNTNCPTSFLGIWSSLYLNYMRKKKYIYI